MRKGLSTMLALLLVTPGAAQQPVPEITVYRTWRPPNVTVVEGLFRVDPALLGTADCAYNVELKVHDAAGLQLVANEWQGRCPQLDGAPAPALETFEFAVVPASYTVSVTVAPQARPTDRRTGTVTVQGLEAPLASDLILANAVGYVDSTNAAGWTLKHGTIGIQAASRTIVPVSDPALAFYFEVYPPANDALDGAAWGIVRRPDGKELARVQLARLDSTDESRPIAGTLPVAGLPTGSYVLEASLQLEDTTVTRSGKFEVSAAAVQADASGRTGYFWDLGDEELERTFAPIVVWLTAAELRVYETLSPAGKREFLARQFGVASPDPNDGNETALEVFLARATYVNEHFTERTSQAVQGPWETDRGRIWMIRGEPTTRVTRPNPQAGNPYELWVYSQERGYAYLFADETRMGHFRLIFTNDPNQVGVSNWTRLIGNQAIQDMQRLGVVLPRTDDLSDRR